MLLHLPVQQSVQILTPHRLPTKDSQLLKNTRVQIPLRSPTLPKLLVVIIQALPVRPERVQALPVDILQHARRTARNLPSFLQTFRLALAVGLGFAVHEIIVVGFASCADEEGCGEERGGGGADLGDFGDGVGERSGVDEHLLVESGLSGGHGVGVSCVWRRSGFNGCRGEVQGREDKRVTRLAGIWKTRSSQITITTN